MKIVLITGITGQDGSYLAEFMLERDYQIIGTVSNTLLARARLPKELLDKVELVEWDMLDYQKILQIVTYYRPIEIYNLAAYSSGAKMFDNPIGMVEVNGLAVTRLLEAIREVDLKIRFCQASSSEIFGEPAETPQTEITPINPCNPYGVAKHYADLMIRIYRQRYNMFACSAILFNHESPRRRLEFVTRKITHEAAKIKLGLSQTITLGNLDAIRDWGFAGDYVCAMWLMLQQTKADDYVVATGKAHSVRDVCELVFNYLEMDYHDYILMDESLYRPEESVLKIGSSAKAYSKLDWKPKVEFKELLKKMVDEELKNLSGKN
jgi:GDPmannose 4,6-dehydratase